MDIIKTMLQKYPRIKWSWPAMPYLHVGQAFTIAMSKQITLRNTRPMTSNRIDCRAFIVEPLSGESPLPSYAVGIFLCPVAALISGLKSRFTPDILERPWYIASLHR